MIQVHEVVMFPLQTNHDDDGERNPEIDQAIDELFEYGYIYRWIDDETGEWLSATYEHVPGPHPSASQYNAYLRLLARFPNGPWKFPDSSKTTRRARERAIKSLTRNGVHHD